MISTEQILLQVRDRLLTKGWHKGSTGSADGPNCLYGALVRAHDCIIIDCEVNALVQATLGPDLQDEIGPSSVTHFNDNPETQLEDIIGFIDQLVYDLETGEAA